MGSGGLRRSSSFCKQPLRQLENKQCHQCQTVLCQITPVNQNKVVKPRTKQVYAWLTWYELIPMYHSTASGKSSPFPNSPIGPPGKTCIIMAAMLSVILGGNCGKAGNRILRSKPRGRDSLTHWSQHGKVSGDLSSPGWPGVLMFMVSRYGRHNRIILPKYDCLFLNMDLSDFGFSFICLECVNKPQKQDLAAASC